MMISLEMGIEFATLFNMGEELPEELYVIT